MSTCPFVVGTRYFEKDPQNADAGITKLSRFISNMQQLGASKILIAVNVKEDTSNALQMSVPENTVIFPVEPWGGFINPLNSILIMARPELAIGCNMLLASLEVTIAQTTLATLSGELNDTTLVVGPAMIGHNYTRGIHGPATGRQCPWNTLALWNAKYLWTSGFALLGDGALADPESKGVEEVSTIKVLQMLYPGKWAKLIQIAGISWDTSNFTAERLVLHEKKMASKDARPKKQLDSAGLQGPVVYHI